MPWFWVIAGPNGSGKSTLAQQLRLTGLLSTPEETNFLWINPDEIRRGLSEQNFDDQNNLDLMAAERADELVANAIAANTSFARETVLSTDRLFPLMIQAKDKGYKLGLIFVFLFSPDINIDRIRTRVALGGHPVPEQKVRARWAKALALLPRAAEMCDSVLVYDNTAPAGQSPGPILVYEKTPTSVYLNPCVVRYEAAPQPLSAAIAALKHQTETSN